MRVRVVWVLLAGLTVCDARPVSAQSAGDVGVTMGYPGALGVVWHVTDGFALRPDVGLTRTTSDSTTTSTGILGGAPLSSTNASTGWGSTVGLSALVTVRNIERLRLYLTPRLAYSHATSDNETGFAGSLSAFTATTKGVIASGSFGAQYNLHDRFALFGELGVQVLDAHDEIGLPGLDERSRQHVVRPALGRRRHVLFLGRERPGQRAAALPSVGAQRRQRLDPHGAAGRHRVGPECGDEHDSRGGTPGHGIEWRDAVEQPAQQAGSAGRQPGADDQAHGHEREALAASPSPARPTARRRAPCAGRSPWCAAPPRRRPRRRGRSPPAACRGRRRRRPAARRPAPAGARPPCADSIVLASITTRPGSSASSSRRIAATSAEASPLVRATRKL